MKPSSLFTKKQASQSQAEKNIQHYLTEIASDADQSANIMIDISDLHSHFYIDVKEKNQDSATNFERLSKYFKEHQGIEFIHKNAIKIHRDHFSELLQTLKTYRKNKKTFNRKLNVFLLTHGGPAWFFGPIQDFFKEKIGMVWVGNNAPPQAPYYHYSHFVLTLNQLYFFPAGINIPINCGLSPDEFKRLSDVFDRENLKPYFNYTNHFKIHAMSRSELQAMMDFVSFDIELDENIAWYDYDGFHKKEAPLITKQHFVFTQKQLFFYNLEQYIEMKRANIQAIKKLFPKNTMNTKSAVLRYPILAQNHLQNLKILLGLTGITWKNVAFRQLDFISGEREGTKFVAQMLDDLTRMTGTQVQHVFLHSCFSAAEFYNEKTQNHMLSCARMCSVVFKDIPVTGCVGINADSKATHLLLKEDIQENGALTIGRHFNLIDSLVTYQNGLLIKKPPFHFFTPTKGAYFKILQSLIFPNEVKPYLQLEYLDDLIPTLAESFGHQQWRLYPK